MPMKYKNEGWLPAIISQPGTEAEIDPLEHWSLPPVYRRILNPASVFCCRRLFLCRFRSSCLRFFSKVAHLFFSCLALRNAAAIGQ